MPRCKICRTKFDARYFLQKTCLETECVLRYSEQEKLKKWKVKKKKMKEALKTHKDYLKELQIVFNRWVRLRDKGNLCISCQKRPKKENAGHYRSSGGNPELTFEPLNVHLQCEHCNTYLHGNLIDYRINLIKKIGLEKVEWLESSHDANKYTIPELKEMKVFYNNEIKRMNGKS